MQFITRNKQIDTILNQYKVELGPDYDRYRGHCYRLLNYCILMDLDKSEFKQMEVAIPFHDLGIWTHTTMDYLKPSADLAQEYVLENNLELDTENLKEIIVGHHKLNGIKGNDLAEKLRKADLVDLSFGLIPCGLKRKDIKTIQEQIPSLKFHRMIFGNVIRHAASHWSNPFPMMKW